MWCVPGGGGCWVAGCFDLSQWSPDSAREVIDAPLPQRDYIPRFSLPPPPGGLTTARTPSTSRSSLLSCLPPSISLA